MQLANLPWNIKIIAGMISDAIPLFLLAFLAFAFYKDKPTAKSDPRVWRSVWHQLKIALGAKSLWFASGLLFLVQFAPGFYTPLMFYQTDTLHFDEKFISLISLCSAVAGAVGALFYVHFCRRYTLRQMLYACVFFTAALSLLYLGYHGRRAALMIEIVYAFAVSLAQLPLYDLAARATPKGSEAVGYSIIVSVWNGGLLVSDLAGSALYEKLHLTFMNLVWLNAGTTLLAFIAVPLLPAMLVDRRETGDGNLTETATPGE
jgi:predicted MFS family arabinose efflux permease